MRKIKIRANEFESEIWSQLNIKGKKVEDGVEILLPSDMWLEKDEYQLYEYKINCPRNIILGYVYADQISLNEHGRDIYLTAQVNYQKYKEYLK